MTSLTPWFCLGLFAAGAVAGWLLPATPASPPPSLQKMGKATPAAGSTTIPGLPDPSGLPRDLIHLTTITDTRTLRALWTTGDEATREELVKRWAEVDPADGIQFFLLERVDGAPRGFLDARVIARLWTERDPVAFLKYLAPWSGDDFITLCDDLSSLMERCLIADPAGLIAFWKTAPDSLKDQTVWTVFGYWFKHDPSRALAEAAMAPRKWQQNIWAAAAWAEDPAAMLATLLKSQEPDRHPDAVKSLIEKLAKNDLPAAQAAAAKLPHGPARTKACAKVVEALAKKDPEAAWAWMEAEAPTNENRREAAEALLEKDPIKAIALDPQGTWWPKTDLIGDYASELAKTDWPAMVGLAKSVGPTLRDQIIRAVAASFSWDEGDPLPKLEQLGSLMAGFEGEKMAVSDSIFDELNPAAAPGIATWLKAQPEEVRGAFIEPMVSRLKSESPAAAAAWLAQLPPGEVRTEQLLQTTADWAGTDPAAAATFSLTLPPGTARDYAILNTALAWHRNQPAAARDWLDGLPDSPVKTRTLLELDRGK